MNTIKIVNSELLFVINTDRDEIIQIPEGVTTIKAGALAGDKYVKKVIIPSSVKIINDRAFAKCSKLEEIDIPDSVEFVGNYCFESCINLKILKCDLTKTLFGDRCFSHCKSLEKLIMPTDEARIFYFEIDNQFAMAKLTTTLKGDYKVYSGHFGSSNFPTLTPPPWNPRQYFVEHTFNGKTYFWYGLRLEPTVTALVFQEREKTIQKHFKKDLTLDTVINADDFTILTGISEICVKHALDDFKMPYETTMKIKDVLDLLFKTYPGIGRRLIYVLQHQNEELNLLDLENAMTMKEMLGI